VGRLNNAAAFESRPGSNREAAVLWPHLQVFSMFRMLKRLDSAGKAWLVAAGLVLFVLFQSGGEDYRAPSLAASEGYESSTSAYKSVRAADSFFNVLFHYYTKGGEERLYLNYANLFLGHPYDRESFLAHRGSLGVHEELLTPGRKEGPLLPYRDIGLEYPPLNIPFIMAPRMLVEQPFDYFTLYDLEMGGLALLTLLGGLWIADRHLQLRTEQKSIFLRNSTLGLLALGNLYTTRLDIILCLFLIGAVIAALHKKPILCGVLLALATGAKLFPLVMVPIFSTYFWQTCSRKASWRFTVAWTFTTALVFVPWALIGGERFWVMLWFHGSRPLQVESSYASLLLLDKIFFDGPAVISHFQGSFNVVSPHNSILVKLSTVAMFGGALLVSLVHLKAAREAQTDRQNAELLIRAIVALLGLLMVVSKVFSPQYLMWFWPLAFLIWGRDSKPIHVTLLAITLLTQILFPVFYGDLVRDCTLQSVAILASRNLLLAFLTFLLALGLWSENNRERIAEVFEQWFNTATFNKWAYSVMAVMVLFQFLGKGALIWPNIVFFDSESSLIGALAFNLAHGDVESAGILLVTTGPLAILLYGALISFGLDSVTAGILLHQSSFLLLATVLVLTLSRIKVPLVISTPLVSLLLIGHLAGEVLTRVTTTPLVVALGLLLINLLFGSPETATRRKIGFAVLVPLLLLSFTVIGVAGALLTAACVFCPFWKSRPEMIRLLVIFTLVILPPSLLFANSRTLSDLGQASTTDLMLGVLTLVAAAVCYLRAPANTVPIVGTFFLATLLTSTASIVVLGFEPFQLLELKVAGILVVGTLFVDDRYQKRTILGWLPAGVILALIAQNPYEQPTMPPINATRTAMSQVQNAVRDRAYLVSDNSFVLLMMSDSPIEVQTVGEGFSYVKTARSSDLFSPDKQTTVLNGPSWGGFTDPTAISRRHLFRLNQYLQRTGKLLGSNIQIECNYPPFLVVESQNSESVYQETRPLGPFPIELADAACRDDEGRIYIFRGKEYWRWDPFDDFPEYLYPRLIADDWVGIPNDIEAAVNGGDGFLYFFKDPHCWRWNLRAGHSLDRPVDKRKRWKQVPMGLDAAAEGADGTLYFFKQNQFWVWSVREKEVVDSPRPLPARGTPVDAALSGLDLRRPILWRGRAGD
jgi:Hemopexin/Glycosyltransferase family 87